MENVFSIDDAIAKLQIEKLNKIKSVRDNTNVQQLLQKIEATAKTQNNLMPVIIEAVEAYASLGEISDALRKVFGEYKS